MVNADTALVLILLIISLINRYKEKLYDGHLSSMWQRTMHLRFGECRRRNVIVKGV